MVMEVKREPGNCGQQTVLREEQGKPQNSQGQKPTETLTFRRRQLKNQTKQKGTPRLPEQAGGPPHNHSEDLTQGSFRNTREEKLRSEREKGGG